MLARGNLKVYKRQVFTVLIEFTFSIVAGLHLFPPPITFLTKLMNLGFFLGMLSKVIMPSNNDLTSLSIVLDLSSTAA